MESIPARQFWFVYWSYYVISKDLTLSLDIAGRVNRIAIMGARLCPPARPPAIRLASLPCCLSNSQVCAVSDARQ